MMTAFRCSALLFAASVAFGQPASRTFHLTTMSLPAQLNEMATILRTVGDMRQINVNPSTFDITVSDGNLDLAGWLVKQLDTTEPKAGVYTVPGSGEVVHIFFAAHSNTQVQLNELVTNLRVVADIQHIFTYSASHAVAIRTTAVKDALASWMIAQLDVAPDDQSRWQPHVYQIAGDRDPVVRVVYLLHTPPGPGLNEIVTNLRVVGNIQRMFERNQPQAIVFRTTAEQAQLAEWIILNLDVQPDAQMRADKHEYKGSSDDVTRVYYMKTADPSQVATLIHNDATPKVFANNTNKAIAVRGTAEMIATADRIVSQQDK